MTFPDAYTMRGHFTDREIASCEPFQLHTHSSGSPGYGTTFLSARACAASRRDALWGGAIHSTENTERTQFGKDGGQGQ